LFKEERWRSVFPADVLDLVSTGGEAYAVPLNIHRTNSLVFDVQAFAKASLAPPRTLDELHGVAAAFRKQGLRPLALGTRQPWMLSLLTFEIILVSLAGPRFYLEFLQGKRSPREPEVRAAIEELGRLLDASDPDSDRLSWDEAADRVRIGAAAMTLGGDWTKGYLERRGCLEGEHFGLTASPGTENTFVFTIDTFGLPRGAPHREGAIELLRIFGSSQGQNVFNRIKGSRPARSDLGADTMASLGPPSSRSRGAARSGSVELPPVPDAFESTMRVPTLTSLVPPSFSGALDASLAEFARTREVSSVLEVIERQYSFIES
jgi:glucose/mannose transport system substrate-binding protein